MLVFGASVLLVLVGLFGFRVVVVFVVEVAFASSFFLRGLLVLFGTGFAQLRTRVKRR